MVTLILFELWPLCYLAQSQIHLITLYVVMPLKPIFFSADSYDLKSNFHSDLVISDTFVTFEMLFHPSVTRGRFGLPQHESLYPTGLKSARIEIPHI